MTDEDTKPDDAMSDEAIHKEALEEFKRCQDAHAHNLEAALGDLKFGRLNEQWYEEDIANRKRDGRPCMTFNLMPAFIRQVVNDGRQNKPAIKVHPADDKADPPTALVYNDLIRNIEATSNADVAYDTGLDFAASCGIGYWKVGIEYSHDDAFEMDIEIQRISNPLAVWGDWRSTAADASDWTCAFEVDTMSKGDFDAKYRGKDKTDWESDSYRNMSDAWRSGEDIIVASYWRRREVARTICKLSDGRIVGKDWLDAPVPDVEGLTNGAMLQQFGVTVTGERETKSWKVVQYVMNGVEVLDKTDWPGRFIPIVPVYGEEVNVEGKRYFRSLIRDAKDAQRNFNYWRTTSTELVALAPKAPYIGVVGQFDTDNDKWAAANTASLPFIEYDNIAGAPPPQRQPFAGVPAGALQEAMNASDDMKAITGLYNASLGARSNETSGTAINARKVEGDNSTFHFIDNQARAIRYTGLVIIDLIPHVYNKERVIRVMGEDKKPRNVQLAPGQQPAMQQAPAQPGQPVPKPEPQTYDLCVGKYDLTVSTGPGFQTKREEAAYGMIELMRALPQSAAVVGPHLAKSQDWPGAEEIGEELQAALGKGPAAQAADQQIQELTQQLQQCQQQLQGMQADKSIDEKKVQIDYMNAETTRMKAMADLQKGDGAPMEDPNALTEAQKIEMEAHYKMQLQAMVIEGNERLELLKQQGQSPDPAQQQEQANFSSAMQSLLGEVARMQRLITAPRKRTLVRGPDGRAVEAMDEIIMPEEPAEQPQEAM